LSAADKAPIRRRRAAAAFAIALESSARVLDLQVQHAIAIIIGPNRAPA